MNEAATVCPNCGRATTRKHGRDRQGRQIHQCLGCRRRFTALTGTPFSGYRFPPDVIAVAVQWYLRFRLSYADVAELLAERGVSVDASTVYAWVREFAPLYEEAARPFRRAVGSSWSVDETYMKIAGKSAYVYRAIDEQGQVVDVPLRSHRDLASARACFVLATYRRRSTPDEVFTDQLPAYARAVREEMPGATHTPSGRHRASGPETKAIARLHLPTKDRVRPMRGLQAIRTGQRGIDGIALVRAVHRGHIALPGETMDDSPHARVRADFTTIDWLADGLRVAARNRDGPALTAAPLHRSCTLQLRSLRGAGVGAGPVRRAPLARLTDTGRRRTMARRHVGGGESGGRQG